MDQVHKVHCAQCETFIITGPYQTQHIMYRQEDDDVYHHTVMKIQRQKVRQRQVPGSISRSCLESCILVTT